MPCRDPDSDKYPDRTWYRGHWRPPEYLERARASDADRKRRLRGDPEFRERELERERARCNNMYANDPAYRNKKKISVLRHKDRKRRERNVNEILALRVDGDQGDSSRDRTAA